MSERAKKLERFMSIRPLDFSICHKLALEVLEEGPHSPPETILTLEAHTERKGDTRILKLIFWGVGSLKIEHHSSLLQLSQLEIIDISDNHWENIHFHVIEEENHVLSFYCRDFNFELFDKYPS